LNTSITIQEYAIVKNNLERNLKMTKNQTLKLSKINCIAKERLKPATGLS